MGRHEALRELAAMIAAIERPHPVRVAIDGIDCAGKTTLADEVAPLVEALGRPVIRASLDGFHRPRVTRYRRGRESPDGYYADSFDLDELRRALLAPLGPSGDRRCRTVVFDVRRDTSVAGTTLTVPDASVLLFDGVFLLRPELAECWDVKVFLEVTFEEALRRASGRDVETLGSPIGVRHLYERRYFPAQRRYLRLVRPHEVADIVVDNNDPEAPRLQRARA